ncbi:hypothetical protein HHK36_015887 [Tetracentron sinense]|uniref:Uncharacterized protein n=1 Tax=Tetracentron sinense TaxID=13715 RepID=A0A834Z1V5_TETSI|nr:hypothetical protein HHK36_015887 [Tetracentron sinense]
MGMATTEVLEGMGMMERVVMEGREIMKREVMEGKAMKERVVMWEKVAVEAKENHMVERTLHEEHELPTKLARQNDWITGSSAQSTPSTDGISNLYTPNLSVVLLTEKEICSVVLGDSALNLHSM